MADETTHDAPAPGAVERSWLSTGQVAALINQVIQMPGAYSTNYVRQEVESGVLRARVNEKRQGNTKKSLIKIHPDDFYEWARRKVHPDELPQLDAAMRDLATQAPRPPATA